MCGVMNSAMVRVVRLDPGLRGVTVGGVTEGGNGDHCVSRLSRLSRTLRGRMRDSAGGAGQVAKAASTAAPRRSMMVSISAAVAI